MAKKYERKDVRVGLKKLDHKYTRERIYTIEALVLLNQINVFMNLLRALVSALVREPKLSKKSLRRVLNLNIPRAG